MSFCFSIKKKKLEFEQDVFILVPGFRQPLKNNLFIGLSDHVSSRTVELLCSSRKQLALAVENSSNGDKKAKKKNNNNNSSKSTNGYPSFPDAKKLYSNAEVYLSIILGLIGDGCKVTDAVDFSWSNMEDKTQKETELGTAYYEVVSVLHILSMCLFSKANESILKTYKPNSPLVIEKSTRDEAMNYLNLNYELLDTTVQTIFPKIVAQFLNSFPLDVNKSTFLSLKHQARGYALELELIKYLEDEDVDIKENLILKKNLACEMFYSWKNALTLLDERKAGNLWGEKHLSFMNWKLKSSQSIAYFFYGLFLDNSEDEIKEENCHGNAVACLNRSKNLLNLLQDIPKEFANQNPTSRPPISWNAMQFLKDLIPKTALRIERVNKDVYRNEKVPEDAPNLPQPVQSFTFKKVSWAFPPLHSDWN